MKGFLKWMLMGGGLFLVLIVGAIFLIPKFVVVQKYKPMIEELVTEQTGRCFCIGVDICRCVFNGGGVSLSDLHLGNSKGFKNADMVAVKRFEVRLKVMPLFSRRIEISTFVVDTPRFFLEKTKDGKANWENIGPVEQSEKKAVAPEKKDSGKKDPAEQNKTAGPSDGKLPIESLIVGNFSILNGFVSYVDKAAGVKKEVADLNLTLTDISLDKPIGVKLSAKLDGKPVSLEGSAGPVGKEPGKEDIYLDMTLKALEQLSIHIKGKIVDPMTAQKIAMDLDIASFSPRKLLSGMGQPFPVTTADPKVLDKVALKVRIEGGATAVTLSNGVLTLDDSKLTFLAEAKAFDKPDLKFDLNLDSIDLDRYLPPKEEKTGKQTSDQKSAAKKAGQKEKTDYGPLRKLLLDGKIKVGSLKVANVRIQDFVTHVTAKKGVINMDPVGLNLYQGSVASTIRLDVRKDDPKTKLTLDAKGVQAGPLLKDAIEKEIIEGTLVTSMTLNVTGETPDMVKKSLKGKGEVKFVDGAIVGIDIANTVRNATAGLGLGETPAEKPRTDFAELKIPFSADKGIVNIPGASLISPLIRLLVTGDANLPTEGLDFRVEPKVVATLKGQGDTQDRSGLMVPLLVTGSFDSPKIRPDLQGMISGGVPDAETINQLIKPKASSSTSTESVEDTAKGLLKGFFPGSKD
jgi:AsmA protein